MSIDDKTLLYTPSSGVKIVTVVDVKKTPGENNGYELRYQEGRGSQVTIPVAQDGEKLMKSLYKGDKLIFIWRESDLLYICGPINEETFYHYKPI